MISYDPRKQLRKVTFIKEADGQEIKGFFHEWSRYHGDGAAIVEDMEGQPYLIPVDWLKFAV